MKGGLSILTNNGRILIWNGKLLQCTTPPTQKKIKTLNEHNNINTEIKPQSA